MRTEQQIKRGDRVRVCDPLYCVTDVGTIGTILDEGHYSLLSKDYRYLVRWEGSDNVWGVHAKSIELIPEHLIS